MRNNYFVKLINYIKNVYHIYRGLSKLTDGRVNPTYQTELVITVLLFGFLLRIRGMNELNCIFNNLKTYAGLEHCYVHGGNSVEAVLSLIFIANNLFQLFKVRRIKNHIPIQRELVRLLLKGLYLMKYDNKLIFNSG